MVCGGAIGLGRGRNRPCQAPYRSGNGVSSGAWCPNGSSVGVGSVDVVIVTRVVKLPPTPEQASALAATPHACNTAGGLISEAAYAGAVFERNGLQKAVYQRVRQEHGLGAQAAVRCVKKVVDAYTALHAQVKAGRLKQFAESRSAKRLPAKRRKRETRHAAQVNHKTVVGAGSPARPTTSPP
jgi:hypothetical protein